MTERDILQSISQGNNEAFRYVYKTYFAALCGYALLYFKRKEDAENVVQDVMISLWDKRADAAKIQSLKAYLFGALRFKCINHIEHRRVVQQHDADLEYRLQLLELETEDWFEESDVYLELEQAVAELPEQCQRVFRMKRVEGMSYREISQQLGITERTVETHVAHAVKQLKARCGHLLITATVLFLLQILQSVYGIIHN